MSADSPLERISIVLVKTSHPGNIGSVARAMKTMGLSKLRLVAPKEPKLHTEPEAIALASGAQDVLEQIEIFQDLPSALHDTQWAYALSARLRELGPALQTPAQASLEALQNTQQPGSGCAFVFGAERTGLSNEEVQLCNRQVYIPSNPVYNSLNLSQAVQIMCYSLRISMLGMSDQAFAPALPNLEKSVSDAPALASVKAVSDMQAHCLQAMEAVGFLNPEKPKKLINRMARLWAKLPLEQEEVDLLRGFYSDIIRVAQGRLYPRERHKPED